MSGVRTHPLARHLLVLVSMGCGRIGFDPSTCAALPVTSTTPPTTTGTTYHVSPTGADTRTCTEATSPATPRATIAAGLECVQGGDTLVLHAGTYTEEVSTYTTAIRGGTSWDTATHVTAAPGESVIVMSPGGAGVRSLTLATPESSWTEFDDIIWDATNIDPALDAAVKITYVDIAAPATHVRIKGGEIRNSPSEAWASDFTSELIGVDIHDNSAAGTLPALAPHGDNTLVEGCRIHDNGGRSIEIYNSSNTTSGLRIVGNIIYRNGDSLLVGSADDIEVARNVLWGDPNGIDVDYNTPQRARIVHNTVVGGAVPDFCVYLGNVATNTLVGDNICVATTGLRDMGAGTQAEANLTTDPSFVDPVQHDYALAAGSSALDSGIDIAGIPFAGAGPDIGAFEAPVATAATLCDPQRLRITFDVAFPPLQVPACDGFAVVDGTMQLAITGCTAAGTVLELALATPTSPAAIVKYTGTNVTDSATIGGAANAHLLPFELAVAP